MGMGMFILFRKLVLLTLTENSPLVEFQKVDITFGVDTRLGSKVQTKNKPFFQEMICAGVVLNQSPQPIFGSGRPILPLSKTPKFVSLS